ncbi:MAG: CheB methylesterase [Pedosphaera sp.]|nr:CheB methylesterase [Pedosphaera sp.]
MRTIVPKVNWRRRKPQRIKHPDVVVVGASAGGVEAFRTLIRSLPADFPAAIFVVIHISPASPSPLPKIFSRVTRMPVVEKVEDGTRIKPGHIYVAPPDFHLLLEPRCLHLVRGPTENRHRPAIDPLFRSAAHAYDRQVIGLLLTGNLDDGTAGLSAIKQCGGIAIVQDPNDALYPDMPRHALENLKVDYTVPLAQMPALLVNLVNERQRRRKSHRAPPRVAIETLVDEMKKPMNQMESLGKSSDLTCPHCHGVLWGMMDGKLLRFRCRVGHAFTAENLEVAQSEQSEIALWSALRALEEKAALLRQLAARARKQRHSLTALEFEKKVCELKPSVKTLRNMLVKSPL